MSSADETPYDTWRPLTTRRKWKRESNLWRFTSNTKALIEMKISRGLITYFDSEDLHLIQLYKWYSNVKEHLVYVDAHLDVNSSSQKHGVRLHRLIMQSELTDVLNEVDHIDGNTLNNSKSNLRAVTPHENTKNQKLRNDNATGVKGVWHYAPREQYIAEWHEDNHKKKTKYFSYKVSTKRTTEEAFALAVTARREAELRVGYNTDERPKEGTVGQIVAEPKKPALEEGLMDDTKNKDIIGRWYDDDMKKYTKYSRYKDAESRIVSIEKVRAHVSSMIATGMHIAKKRRTQTQNVAESEPRNDDE